MDLNRYINNYQCPECGCQWIHSSSSFTVDFCPYCSKLVSRYNVSVIKMNNNKIVLKGNDEKMLAWKYDTIIGGNNFDRTVIKNGPL